MKKILVILSLLIAPSISHALTLSQIRTEIRIRIRDSNTSRQRYSDTQLLNMINQTQRDVINYTWLITKSGNISLVSGTTNYATPNDLIGIIRITLDGLNLPEKTLEGLDSDANGGNWLLNHGKPSNYYQDPSLPDYVSMYPWPATSLDIGTIHVNYSATATDLVSDSDVPFNAIENLLNYNDLLIYEPCYKVFLIEGENEKATEYRTYYENRLQNALTQAGSKPNYNPNFSGQRK